MVSWIWQVWWLLMVKVTQKPKRPDQTRPWNTIYGASTMTPMSELLWPQPLVRSLSSQSLTTTSLSSQSQLLRLCTLHFQKDHDLSPPLCCLSNSKLLHHCALHVQKDHCAQRPRLLVNLQFFHSSQTLIQFNSVKAIFTASKTPRSFRRLW